MQEYLQYSLIIHHLTQGKSVSELLATLISSSAPFGHPQKADLQVLIFQTFAIVMQPRKSLNLIPNLQSIAKA